MKWVTGITILHVFALSKDLKLRFIFILLPLTTCPLPISLQQCGYNNDFYTYLHLYTYLLVSLNCYLIML